MRFTSLRVENWRNFARVDIELQARVFLVGPNAAGKSNLLDVFRFLRDIVSVGGGLQEAVESRGGVSRIRSLAARRNPDIRVAVAIGSNPEKPEWQYELSFGQDNKRRPLIKAEVVRHDGRLVLSRPNAADKRDPARLGQTYLEQVTANQRFREIAEFFSSINYLHIVPQLIREPDRSVGRVQDPFGGDFLEQLARASPSVRAARLKRIERALKIAVPQLRELQLQRDSVTGTPHLRGLYEHWRPNAGWQTEEDFSDGTLRLLGLLWSLLDGDGPLLLEEPELSLHADVVRYIPQMIARTQRTKGRQVLLSTHAAELLYDEGIALDEVFLLTPGSEGTTVTAASEIQQVQALLQGGLNVADAVLPRTKPRRAEQLALFGEK